MSLPTEPPHSCALCQSRFTLTYGNYPSPNGWYKLIDENYYATGEAYVFNVAYREAVSLAEQGCALCAWLVSASLRREDTCDESFLRGYFAHNSREVIVLDWVLEVDDWIDGGNLGRKVVVCAEERLPNLDPSSDETVELMKGWLRECLTTHVECQELQSSNKSSQEAASGPRRLLHLSGSTEAPRVRLWQNSASGALLEYAALSYCWGGDQAVKLKDELVDSWAKGIPYEEFPRTIQDAVWMTMGLGLEYLWVDALCIIQDSEQDKAEQISRMAEIYEQAYVTISAARATAAPEGFLHSRYIAGEKGFRMPFTCEDGQMSEAVLWQGREPDAWEPIDQRSWCLQESILSPRVLEFGTHNVRLRCARSRAEEAQLRCDGWVGHSKTFAQLGMTQPLVSSIDWKSLDEPYEFVQVWQMLVSHYTRRGLGWYQDKLLAISAIARKMSRVTGSKRYIAGLWTEHLGEMLLWHPNHGPDAKEKARRHATYVAPSWSWGSCSGEIDFWLGSAMHLLEFVGCEVDTAIPGDEFSAVVGARLELRTLVMRATMRRGDGEWLGGGGMWFLWDEEVGSEVDGSLMLDVEDEGEESGGEFACEGGEEVVLALVQTQDALVLKRKKGEEEEEEGVQALRLVAHRPLLSPSRPALARLTSASSSLSSASSPFSTTRFASSSSSPASASASASASSNPALAFPCLDAIESRSARLSATSSPSSTSSSSSSSSSPSSSAGPEPAYTSGATQTFHCDSPLLLDWGGVLPSFTIAYETWGRLNADRSNAILLHTGLSASSHARSNEANPAPGWWEKFIGPGAPLDTDRFHVICTNVIGGCYGSTGPSSIDPANGETYATRFPILTLHDMVRAQFRLLDHLGISRLYASVGSSMGGMQSLAAAALFPQRVARVASISGCARSHPYSIAMRHTQRQVLMMDPNWNRGFYYGRVPPHAGMKLAREIATVTYRSGPEWEQRFGRRRADPTKPPALCPDFLIETYLDHAGEKWCLNYDPNSLLYVSKAMDLFDLGHENQMATQARRKARENALATSPYDASSSPQCNLTLPSEPYQEQPDSSSSSSSSSQSTTTSVNNNADSSYRPPEDLVKGLSPLRDIPTLVMGVASDILFPAWQQREIAEALRLGGNRSVTHVELSEETSLFGHDTFLLDLKNVGGNLRLFLD
ncbi:Serine O-acetyltransferase [Trichoderma ghanense]|uniref:Serine O-acetyltransferase n=1 Tax=Trichoderma ghanense TaxID=65468 RepID=A0ABY2GYP8_9HYPO